MYEHNDATIAPERRAKRARMGKAILKAGLKLAIKVSIVRLLAVAMCRCQCTSAVPNAPSPTDARAIADCCRLDHGS